MPTEINPNDFYTLMPDGTEIPVRRLGTNYIIGYSLFDREEFLGYVRILISEDVGYEDDDISFAYINHIDWDEELPSIKFCSEKNEDAELITLIELW